MNETHLPASTKVAIIGLGYVGLPLAVVLSHKFDCTGFDSSESRIRELKEGWDRTDEVEKEGLLACPLRYTMDPEKIRGADIYIVTVPTPVDEDNEPDLAPVLSSCRLVGPLMEKGAIVVFESTVYPGVTEEVCGPALEKESGFVCGEDFFLGYSPERINPGDREHTVDKITKVISGQTGDVVEKLAKLYGAITTGGVFRARNIKAAEAAKVIENAQRDINIAFVNEITMIFQRMGLSAYDVLEAAGTKWNFLPFTPGLVGGHCIGVDPFYLAHRAKELGHHPEIILAGRHTNDNMGKFIAGCIGDRLEEGARILMLGLTFKENVPDLRNSKVIDVIKVVDLNESSCVERETALIKVHTKPEDRAEALRIADIFRANVIDSSPTSYTIEVTGDVRKVQAIIQLLQPLGIKDIVRTGRVAIAREPIRAAASQPRPLAKAN